jgi:hypothetical protein
MARSCRGERSRESDVPLARIVTDLARQSRSGLVEEAIESVRNERAACGTRAPCTPAPAMRCRTAAGGRKREARGFPLAGTAIAPSPEATPQGHEGNAAVTAKQWILSAFFVAFVLVKVAEAWLGLERWPLTNVAMFLDRRPEGEAPTRVRFYGVRGGETFELGPGDFALTPDEFNRRLRDAEDLSQNCGELARLYGRRQKRRRPLTAAYAQLEAIPRPGARSPASLSIRVDCPLAPSAGDGGAP